MLPQLTGDTAGMLRTALLRAGDPEPAAAAAALAPLPVDRAVAVGLLIRDGDMVRAALDVRPHGDVQLGELIGLLAVAHDEPVDPMVNAALPVVRQLVRMLLPVAGLQS